jgi:hypothetical protein
MNLNEIEYDDTQWIDLAQDSALWQAIMSMQWNFWFH